MMQGYWHKKYKDKSQVPDWFVQFDHQFGGDRQWIVKHHISRGEQVLLQRQK